ncbi:MAG: hypothetical protein WD382_01170 [Halofilum sp. (in: g-proteobacteria)]
MAKLLPIALLFGLLTATAYADDTPDPGEIDVDRIVSKHPDMPARGTDMDSVRGALGEPNDTKGPVGDPPITRWGYDDFNVYFEHERVLHSVRAQRAKD